MFVYYCDIQYFFFWYSFPLVCFKGLCFEKSENCLYMCVDYLIPTIIIEIRTLYKYFSVLRGSVILIKSYCLYFLQKYGHLFFLLQTEPYYMAQLTRIVSMSEIDSK